MAGSSDFALGSELVDDLRQEADTGHPAEVEGIEVGSEVEFGCWRLSVQVRRVRACVKMLYLRRRVFA